MHSKKDKDEQLLKQFEPLLFKTLGRLNIGRRRIDYDDYLQELRLKLLYLAEQFDGDPFKEDIYRFLGFAKQSLYRYTLDLLKKHSQKFDVVNSDVSELGTILHSDLIFDSNPEIQEFFKKASQVLTLKERHIFLLMVEGGYTIQEMADRFGVSRKTMNKYRKTIREKLAPLRGLLKGVDGPLIKR